MREATAASNTITPAQFLATGKGEYAHRGFGEGRASCWFSFNTSRDTR